MTWIALEFGAAVAECHGAAAGALSGARGPNPVVLVLNARNGWLVASEDAS